MTGRERLRLEYVVRGTAYTMFYTDREKGIGNACLMMKNKEVSALQLVREPDGMVLITYRLEPEEERRKGYIEG